MIRRRQPRGRVALVPNQWSGSVQQYYHFLLGYLAPILAWLDGNEAQEITVRDCGPMNRWFATLPNHVNVEVMNVGHFLHVFSGNLQPSVVLRGFDFPDEFDSRKLAAFRSSMLKHFAIQSEADSRITVLDRRITDPFYASKESEIDLAGAARRSTPNLGSWVASLEDDTEMDYIDSTELDVTDQVRQAAETRILIGQHGAGLTNMVFMKPGGVVIEIHPPLPAEATDTFEKLAHACGHDYVRVPQSGVHAAVDPQLLTAALQAHL